MNTFGRILRLTTFGESHGVGIGGVLDGFPAGFEIDFEFIQKQVQRRKTAQQNFESTRVEKDQIQWISGIFEGKTLGTPIAFWIENQNQKSIDYEDLKTIFRPSHADEVYQKKYGIRDHRGGGRASARETLVRVIAGALALQFLEKKGIEICSFVQQIGAHRLDFWRHYCYQRDQIDHFATRMPDAEKDTLIQKDLEIFKEKGNTIGGVIGTQIKNLPTGLGEPLYDKLSARLSAAMLSINAVHGFDFGIGFDGVAMSGAEQNDTWQEDRQNKQNFSGGIQGGISNGEKIYFRTLFKPISSISQKQKMLNVQGKIEEKSIQGRHDTCVVPRAVPIVEAMTALVILDFWLLYFGIKNR